jgi:hypothetical protein
MKKLLFLLVSVIIFVSCSDGTNKKESISNVSIDTVYDLQSLQPSDTLVVKYVEKDGETIVYGFKDDKLEFSALLIDNEMAYVEVGFLFALVLVVALVILVGVIVN